MGKDKKLQIIHTELGTLFLSHSLPSFLPKPCVNWLSLCTEWGDTKFGKVALDLKEPIALQEFLDLCF